MNIYTYMIRGRRPAAPRLRKGWVVWRLEASAPPERPLRILDPDLIFSLPNPKQLLAWPSLARPEQLLVRRYVVTLYSMKALPRL